MTQFALQHPYLFTVLCVVALCLTHDAVSNICNCIASRDVKTHKDAKECK